MNKPIKKDFFLLQNKDEIIREIIENELIEIHFQPIVSIRYNRIYAYEALTRCTHRNNKIPPYKLFNLAKESNLSLELDFLARKKSIEKFKDYYLENNDLILFLNIESTLINTFKKEQDINSTFTKIIDQLKIPYENFMIEIKEDEIADTELLEEFCKMYKRKGFSIVLDDFGTGSSTFDRLNIVRPDLIKLDKSLFLNIDKNLINKEIVNAITKMSHNLGIRVLAEGVEEENSIYTALKSGINLFQGFYFSKPQYSFNNKNYTEILDKIVNVGDEFKRKTISSIKRKRASKNVFSKISNEIINNIKDVENSKDILIKELKKYDFIEAIYIIDANTSVQINQTIIKKLKNNKFKPSIQGDEHYLKEYFYVTNESKDGIYLSRKYISYATGNLCKTFAKKFSYSVSRSYILCLDIILKG